ncbi:MAG TPA: V-type ATP synthase subunit D [Methanolinea sp.]|nr:V-type ATP synthase subunit D [Methanolinea sp.]HQK55949.1 V-type ATP synthase subunit D [Methanolinea sp.]
MKVKLSQGELKRQRDALRQFERYLPTLQLKKQQIQLEILHHQSILKGAEDELSRKMKAAMEWSALLAEDPGIGRWLVPENVVRGKKNVAGVDLPVFERAEFETAMYDLFLEPLWIDRGIEALREIVSLQEEIRILEEGISILNHELRITTQRVNLFEKVKIPEAKEAIRLIKIHLGDQMTNAVGRSKIAKKKIEAAAAMEAGV